MFQFCNRFDGAAHKMATENLSSSECSRATPLM